MSKNRRGGKRSNIIRPKMWLKCGNPECGQTLGYVQAKHGTSAFLLDTDPDRLLIMSHYNSNKGEAYERENGKRGRTYTFDCLYTESTTPEVVPRPMAKEIAEWNELHRLDTERRGRYRGRPTTIEPKNLEHPNANLNPSRYVEGGVTKRNRDLKRKKRRCGRHYTIRDDVLLDYWNKLAGITSEDKQRDFSRIEREAYVKAGKHWEMRLN